MATLRTEINEELTLECLLKESNLRTLFQPIVSFDGGNPESFAVEALTRGPVGSQYESAKDLFNAAEANSELYRLEQIARELAIERFAQFNQENLFINLDPNIIYDDSFRPGNTLSYLEQQDFDRKQIVFEITERNQVKDRTAFEKAVQHYRTQGFQIAVDDVGSGYSNLDKISRLEPDFLKVDMSIVRDIHQNESREKLVETIIDFAGRIDSKVIAEGIENSEELRKLLSMGVDYGQGYYLAEPDTVPPEINPEVTGLDKGSSRTQQSQETDPELGHLARPVKTFSPDSLTREVYRYLEDNPEDRSIVLLRNKEPVGLLMKNRLHQKLSTNMGQSLYWKRSVSRVMEDAPLILTADTDVKRASELVTDRRNETLYDEVIVVDPETGQYRGNVSVKQLLEKITQLKARKARRANPLTGLPGNVEIRDQIQRNLDQERNFALVYVDLDHFKPFNDYYGFERGDQAILLLKEVLNDGLGVYDEGINFLGHIGGDDFVVITGVDKAREFCEYVVDQFDERIRELYDAKDIEEGFIKTTNRQEEVEKFDVMTVSLAVVTNEDRSFESHLEMSEVAAEVKKYAKRNRDSSTFEIDRRS